MVLKFLKGTKIYSVLTGNCPVCHNESMYKEGNPYLVTRTLLMEERCSHCNTKYKIEPSFFFGAMYVSYPVGLIFGGIAFAFAYLIFNLNLVYSYLIIVLVMFISLPIILRISRNIWINIFMGYNKNKSNKNLNT
ncbi:DUF983 domain-containing protein [Winogradskyella sp.]|uniref:DUF983 domain-containing protein n=1 Tax=Winogradskyella sp. TaxID=1883156 RepID=UPI0025F5959A|nr:DUF983 domain-containing protein [Winogradskyella sp.]